MASALALRTARRPVSGLAIGNFSGLSVFRRHLKTWKPLSVNKLFDRSTQPLRDTSNTRAPGTRKLLALEDLRDNPGARPRPKQLGRGNGSSKGKTSGRGHKGIGQRRAPGRLWFEGGQTPLSAMVPKVGQRDGHKHYRPATINLERVVSWIKQGRLSADHPIDMRSLLRSKCLHRIKEDGVKILGAGCESLDFPIHLQVTDASKSVVEAVERAGGKVELVYFNRRGMRAHLHPERFPVLPRSPGYPPPKKAAKYGLQPMHWSLKGLVDPGVAPAAAESQQ